MLGVLGVVPYVGRYGMNDMQVGCFSIYIYSIISVILTITITIMLMIIMRMLIIMKIIINMQTHDQDDI
jgi:ABC-type transport system involved in cytochrome bd biosynthesis fused ATPase/permease subunit